MSVGPVQRDDATAEFFDGAAAGRFLLRQCSDGHLSEPSATACTTCGRAELQWVPAAGGATLVSWAVTWAAAEADPAGPGPELAATVLVIAELDEGPWWWSQLTAADPAGLAVGDRLVISFAAEPGHEPVPVFQHKHKPQPHSMITDDLPAPRPTNHP
jgi:uncharacterized OB-fold protein